VAIKSFTKPDGQRCSIAAAISNLTIMQIKRQSQK